MYFSKDRFGKWKQNSPRGQLVELYQGCNLHSMMSKVKIHLELRSLVSRLSRESLPHAPFRKSVYPEPHLSFGLYLVAFVVALMFWNSCMIVMQYKEARKEELGIDTDDESAAPANSNPVHRTALTL